MKNDIENASKETLLEKLKLVRNEKEYVEEKAAKFQSHLDTFLSNAEELMESLQKDFKRTMQTGYDVLGAFRASRELGWKGFREEGLNEMFTNPYTKLVQRMTFLERQIASHLKKK